MGLKDFLRRRRIKPYIQPKHKGQDVTRASVPCTKPPGKGWKPWRCYSSEAPYDYAEVETWRPFDRETRLVDPANMHPAINVYNLYWRPASDKLTETERLKRSMLMSRKYSNYLGGY